MANPGDRIEVPGRRVGQGRRVGTVEQVRGTALTVRWDTGETTTLTPTAGSVTVLASGRTKRRR